jgi:pimeloyl-ACP methyl ester carboxylesterase
MNWADDLGLGYYCYDQFGTGRSAAARAAAPEAMSSPALWSLLLNELRAHLSAVELDSSIIVAHSFGAALYCELVLRWPDFGRAAAVVLSGLCVSRGEFVSTNERRRAELADRYGEDDADSRFSDTYICDPGVLVSSCREALAARPFGNLNMPDSCLEAIGRIDAPVVVTRGERDICSGFQALETKRAARSCAVIEIKGASHYPFLERPEAYFRALSHAIEGLRNEIKENTFR